MGQHGNVDVHRPLRSRISGETGPVTRCLVLTGGRASDGPYGVDKLLDLGYELTEVQPARHPWHRKARDLLEHRSGRPLDKALRSVPKAFSADLVLAFLESQALTPSWFKRHGLQPYAGRPLAMFACWLADELRRMPTNQRQHIVKAYSGVDLTMVWSENQVDILLDSGFAAGSVEKVNFGCEPGLFPLVDASTRSVPFVAVGLDRGRDYETLFTALEGTSLEVDLYCKPGNISDTSVPPNIHFRGTVPFEEYRRIVSTAQVVIVPTKVMAYPTGQTVALESAATGASLVLTDTPAMREYFSPASAQLVPPHDPAALRHALLALASDGATRSRLGQAASGDVRNRFTYGQMWNEVDQLFRDRGWNN